MKVLFAGLLIVHGLIVAAQSTGSFGSGQPIPNPSWLSWWPTGLGGSWLMAALRLERTPIQALGGVVWLLSGIALVAAGLGVLGIVVPAAWWRSLALGGAGLSLMMLVVHLHPFYGIGLAASGMLLAALVSSGWTVLGRFGL